MGIVLVVSTVAFSVSCSREEDDGDTKVVADGPKTLEAVDNPVQDLEQRWQNLTAKQPMILIGMTVQEVREILGYPDQIHSLHDYPKGRNRIGTTWFYMKDPKSRDRRGREIFVCFDLDDNVIRVRNTGLDYINELED